MNLNTLIDLLKSHLPWISLVTSLIRDLRKLLEKKPQESRLQTPGTLTNIPISADFVEITNNTTVYHIHMPNNWNAMATAVTIGSAYGLIIPFANPASGNMQQSLNVVVPDRAATTSTIEIKP
jgi:hypothetical protein